MAESLELLLDRERYAGFQTASVTQSFDAHLVATSWSVGYATRVSERDDPVRIEAGDLVTLRAGNDVLVEGHVDDDTVDYEASRRLYRVSGRSRVGDLLDCSAVHPSRRMRDVGLRELTLRLTDGYHVTVDDRVPDALEVFQTFALRDGESIADALGRAASARGVLLQDVAGAVVITRVGTERTETVIERGRNVLRGERTRSWRQRYSVYRFRGQTRASDDVNGLSAAQIGHEVRDLGVTRLRRLMVHAHADRRSDLGRRAILERNARAGRSERLVYELPGWRTDEGQLWRPNVRVRVLDDWLDIDAELLVVRVTHQITTEPGRYRTTLELTRPEAFAESEYPVRERGRRWR